ncbi:hypothetical protein EBL84_03795 [Marichromatium sp. AB31]|nr:hypothetical protein EBL84_03795 [Marichromatium sp. AB31]
MASVRFLSRRRLPFSADVDAGKSRQPNRRGCAPDVDRPPHSKPFALLAPLRFNLLAAGRWPLAAGRWPLAAGRWPLVTLVTQLG